MGLSNPGTFTQTGGAFSTGRGATSLIGATVAFGTGGGLLGIGTNGGIAEIPQLTITGFNAAVDRIEFDNLPQALDHYSVTTVGAAQVIALFAAGGAQIGAVTVAGTALATGIVLRGQSGPLTVSATATTVVIDPGTAVLVCFLAGTRIAVPGGTAAVETLRAGDPVLTADGRTVPVRWMGMTRVSTLCADPATVMPVRITAGALADGVPVRDLSVSPDHAMFLDGVLIPARLLVNDTTIMRCDRAGPLEYYHLEVEPHELIVAEGAATESYLDTGNRRHFTQPGPVAVLRGTEPRSWEDACAPLVLAGPQLDAVRAGLARRAAAVRTGAMPNAEATLNRAA